MTSPSYKVSEPFDSTDPPRFGQLVETAKDAIAAELTRFFSMKSDNIREKMFDFPAIQKFAHMGGGSSQKSMETVVNQIMSFGDTPDKFPMIAITSAQVRERSLNIGGTHAQAGTRPARLLGNSGTINLQSGTSTPWTLKLQTWPLGTDSNYDDPVETTLLFDPMLFPDISVASVDEIASAINMQALYLRAQRSPDGKLMIEAGGPAASGAQNAIAVIGGDAECLLALGYTVGQLETYLDYSEYVPFQRHAVCADITINLDVVTDELNTRTALSDLVFDFFSFYLADQLYQITGRSYEDPGLDPSEWYQIIMKREFAWAGEYNKPRQGGEQWSYIHSVRGSVPLTIVDYIDRPVNRGGATLIQSTDVVPNDEMPSGDYFGVNYTRFR